ncbi:unnamed protein product [Protopolystoma xenopodis]|uniref:Uncharacterized protein n=1 Tax=Protopolystoma xenopodis TaxID=117903 RepID=A0A3S5BNE1_9PLAT|nr:unnamed protein product [Protopolystoma xenopodis]
MFSRSEYAFHEAEEDRQIEFAGRYSTATTSRYTFSGCQCLPVAIPFKPSSSTETKESRVMKSQRNSLRKQMHPSPSEHMLPAEIDHSPPFRRPIPHRPARFSEPTSAWAAASLDQRQTEDLDHQNSFTVQVGVTFLNRQKWIKEE